ncbi:LPS export ABC transporter permease LptG [Arenimonas sp.]|jgi:lipopolysaccharide export system permease protein|uniref:LPS export ABC transporter permease LptG n=1 Tax=Arenimonas sp. TaxID=1872635 RepID=UPI0037BE2C1D
MNRIGREMTEYLALIVLKTIALVWLVLLGFDLINAFYNSFSDVGKNGFTLNYALLSTLFTTPRRAYDLLPVVSVIGLLLGLGQLAGKSELIAMASVGVSRLQIAIGALLPAVVLSGAMIITNETVGIASEKQALSLNSHKASKFTLARYSGVWAKDGDLYFNARSGSAKGSGDAAWLELADVRLYRVGKDGALASITQAKSASNQSDHWQLNEVQRTTFKPDSVLLERMGQIPWKTQITNESLEATLSRPGNLSLHELRTNIDYLERNKLDARVFTTAYWGRLFYPFKIALLCLAVLPFAFGSLRSGGLGKSLFLGIIVGVSAMLLERLFVSLSDVYRFDVRVAYVLAPLSVFALCWGYLAKRI